VENEIAAIEARLIDTITGWRTAGLTFHETQEAMQDVSRLAQLATAAQAKDPTETAFDGDFAPVRQAVIDYGRKLRKGVSDADLG
jgi:hypothetical protein